MTTPAAAALYEAQHVAEYAGRGYVVFNPSDRPIAELPFIFGFNNGGDRGFMHAQLIAQDGTPLGSHGCSSEAYMPADLGCVPGWMDSRHEGFRKHYPEGYRMEFVGWEALKGHVGVNDALRLLALRDSEVAS